jgi:hypothetical protein
MEMTQATRKHISPYIRKVTARWDDNSADTELSGTDPRLIHIIQRLKELRRQQATQGF